ncbi:hypothetical protein DFJ77DRAFT_188531 [Powellomyces hirtus]|nr:hypothetical protein DFJ77DRAFT_188531 [Powellomyces hirtus]
MSAQHPPPSQPHMPPPSVVLTPEQAFALEHASHEGMHQSMALILVGSLILSQLTFILWKKLHHRSFHAATLLGLWIVPPTLGLNAGNTRFVVVWAVYSILNSWVIWKAVQTPMKSSTPRLVYKWYSVLYTLSYSVGALGYGTVLLSFFHIPFILHFVNMDTEAKIFEAGIVLLFYGLYFGTCSRDCVVLLSDRMAVNAGYHSRTGFPAKHLRSNMCAICGDSTDLVPADKLHKLNCGHTYHENCIRGYTIIGKKDLCPYCKEKVDLRSFRRNPWDTTQQLYLNLLDAMRFLLVWNPIVFLIVHFVFEVSGLK